MFRIAFRAKKITQWAENVSYATASSGGGLGENRKQEVGTFARSSMKLSANYKPENAAMAASTAPSCALGGKGGKGAARSGKERQDPLLSSTFRYNPANALP